MQHHKVQIPREPYPLSTLFIVIIACHGALLRELGDILPPPVRLLALIAQLEDTQLPQVLLHKNKQLLQHVHLRCYSILHGHMRLHSCRKLFCTNNQLYQHGCLLARASLSNVFETLVHMLALGHEDIRLP